MKLKRFDRRCGRLVLGSMLCLGMITWPGAQATPSGTQTLSASATAQTASLDSLAGGVVLNRTMTIVGHDFYKYFTAAWRERENTERYSIAIVERPTAVRGSEVWIEYRNKRIFRMFLSPRRSAIRKISQQAVGVVYENIVEKDLQQLLYQDHDLAKEELQ